MIDRWKLETIIDWLTEYVKTLKREDYSVESAVDTMKAKERLLNNLCELLEIEE